MTAVLPLSISARPSPHLHNGSRTWDGLPSGTTFGQLALMPAPGGLQDAVSDCLAAVPVTSRLVRNRVEGDRSSRQRRRAR